MLLARMRIGEPLGTIIDSLAVADSAALVMPRKGRFAAVPTTRTLTAPPRLVETSF